MQRQIPAGWAFSCLPPILAPYFSRAQRNPPPPQAVGGALIRHYQSVIPTGADHRESGGLRGGGSCCFDNSGFTGEESESTRVHQARSMGMIPFHRAVIR